MKNQFKKVLFTGYLGVVFCTTVKAQITSTFEYLKLPGQYWNGSSKALGTTFTDENAIFTNYYDTSYGGYWSSGWAYSNIADSVTKGYNNMYAARAGSGYDGSKKYIVGKHDAKIKLTGTALGSIVDGFYITNGTYAATSMRDGDSFAKKFGGKTGNDPDWFKLTVRNYVGGVMTNDSVEFYLSDFRFADNSKDYIVNTWQWVDLTSLGNVDSLVFKLSSSDVGTYGMNTPGFFCLDNFVAKKTSTFEALYLPGTYWNGSSKTLGTAFTDGSAIFKNYYDTSYGGYWSSGWAYSNIADSVTTGYQNMYAARPGVGYAGSEKYLVGKHDAMIKMNVAASGKGIAGFYVTNGTYAATSMRNGDLFAKKFGGVSGNDPDWFKLTIRKYLGGVMTNDSVEFYLADFRSSNNSEDYIVENWQWVDLTTLGNVDSLVFKLSSSDNGTYGMNTPAFFCLDNFISNDIPLSVSELSGNNSMEIFPNPSTNNINVNLKTLQSAGNVVQIIDGTGRIVYSEITNSLALQIPVTQLANGIYYLKVTGNNFQKSSAFIKQ